jgi:stage IV sporulation protein FB
MAIAFRGGYLETGSIWGAPVRFHWSIPIGAFVLGRFRFAPWFWLAFLVLVMIHELGHAAMVRLVHARVVSIEAHGAGGLCYWDGDVSEIGRALIAWGGVLAQLVTFVVATIAFHLAGPAESEARVAFQSAFTDYNLWLAAINLVPIPGFDGAEAWTIVPATRRWWKRRGAESAARVHAKRRLEATIAAQDELERLDEADADADADAGPNPEADEVLDRVFGKNKLERKK